MGFAENLKFCRLGNGFSPAGATQSIPISNDFSQPKRSSKKRWVRNPAKRSWINDFEKETSAFGQLLGKFHLYLPPFKKPLLLLG
jgi:hypothetical protein